MKLCEVIEVDFEITQGAIHSLSAKNSISAEDMLEMMIGVMMDVLKKNGIKDIRKIGTTRGPEFVKLIYPLMKGISDLYENNKAFVTGISDENKQRLESYASDILKAESELEQIEGQEEKLEEKKRELDSVYEKITNTRGHLLTLDEECEKLRAAIDRLNDSSLDRLAEEKDSLEKELSFRTQKKNELDDALQKLRIEAEHSQQCIDELSLDIKDKRAKISEMDSTYKNLEEMKGNLKQEIDRMEEKIECLTEWIKDFRLTNSKKTEEYERLQGITDRYITAWNALNGEKLVRETLLTDPSNQNELQAKTYDDLENAFVQMTERIEALLEVYKKRLDTLVKLSESLTL